MRSLMEWIGKSDDTTIPPRVRIRIFGRDNGRCCNCTRKCGVGGEPWATDHIVALINGGENRESNLQTLCLECHARKTATDVADKAHIYRVRKRHAGIKKPSKFACSRKSRFKKKLDGTVVLRNILAAG